MTNAASSGGQPYSNALYSLKLEIMMNFDTNSFHQIKINGRAANVLYTVPKRYTNLSFLSAGAQGVVVKALDTVTNEQVAIKKILHPFLTTMSARRTYREFVLLTTMKHPNIITLKNAFTPHLSLADFDEIYLVMELMNYNLCQVIRQLKLDNKNLSYFTYQMIVAIKYMHRSGIIHRDLKPSNIVINDKCILKILDFGLARKIEPNERMTVYVVTRYYRAPEVILGLPYDEKVDVWAIGCILAEMINRKILFPGADRLDQWNKIAEVLGTPSKEFINKLEYHTKNFIKSKGYFDPKPMEEIFPDESFVGSYEKAPQLCESGYCLFLTDQNLKIMRKRIGVTLICELHRWGKIDYTPAAERTDTARDLLSKMLKIDPKERISIDEAVQHPFVNLWFRKSEWDPPLPENRYDTSNDLIERSMNEWKELLYNEVRRFEEEQVAENTN